MLYIWSIDALAQSGFNPEDVQFSSLPNMAANILNQLMPDAIIHKVSLHEGGVSSFISHISCHHIIDGRCFSELDGDQILDFCFIDPVGSMD